MRFAAAAPALPSTAELAVPSLWRTLGAFLLALLLQATLLHAVHVRGGIVSLPLLVICWYAAWAGAARAAFFGLLAGAAEDAIGGATGAAWTFATPLVAAGFSRLVRVLGWDHPVLVGVLVAAAAFARVVAAWLVLRMQGATPMLNAHALAWSAALDGTLAAVLLIVFPRFRPFRVEH